MNTNFVKGLLVVGMGLSLAACSSNVPEEKKDDTRVVENKKDTIRNMTSSSQCLKISQRFIRQQMV